VLVIPGNHDIDRVIASTPDQRAWRSSLRSPRFDDDDRDTAFIELLERPDSGPGLFAPLDAYNQFAADYGCDVAVGSPFWSVEVPIDERYRVEIRGMTSVLISDSYDDDDLLLLGDFHGADLVHGGAPGVINVTLCHHPYDWLLDGDRQKEKLRHRSALHITGHDHEHEVVVDPDTSFIHLCAGALQPTRKPEWVPRLYGLSINVEEGDEECWGTVKIVSACWDREEDGFVVDVDRTERIPVTCAERELQPEAQERDVRRLVERLGALQPGDRLSIGLALEADLASLTDGPTYEIPQRLVALAEQTGSLSELWELTERHHGGQESGPNPFRRGS
jgi:hypothetical protein